MFVASTVCRWKAEKDLVEFVGVRYQWESSLYKDSQHACADGAAMGRGADLLSVPRPRGIHRVPSPRTPYSGGVEPTT